MMADSWKQVGIGCTDSVGLTDAFYANRLDDQIALLVGVGRGEQVGKFGI